VLDLPESALDIAALVRRRALSAAEVTGHFLGVVGRRNPELAAFVELHEDAAMRAARALDASLRRDERSELAFVGVPTGIKDHEALRFHFMRGGSRAYRWVYALTDGLVASACRRAGFVFFGKLATSELTILPFIDTALHRPTRNPHEPTTFAGGSSGGSACAVASGMLPIAPGSDGGGSIRIPASFCGLVGIKASRGALPNPYGAVDRVGLSSIGPIARSVRDAAALMDVLAGRPDHAPTPLPESFLAACDEPVRALRIRVLRKTPLATVDPDVDACVLRAARRLEDLGHHLDEGEAFDGSIDDFLPVFGRLMANAPVLPFTERLLQPTTQWVRAHGRRFSNAEALALREALERRVLDWFGDADAWLTPTVPTTAPALTAFAGLDGEATLRAAAPIGAFTAAFNASGQPAASVPAGMSQGGLPIGVQLVGRPGADRRVISLAAALEAALGADRLSSPFRERAAS